MKNIEVLDEVLKTALNIDTLATSYDLDLVLAVLEEMKKEFFNKAETQDTIYKETMMDLAKLLNAKILIIKAQLEKEQGNDSINYQRGEKKA